MSSTDPVLGASRRIARHGTRLDPGSIGPDALRTVSRSLYDTALVALAGAREPAALGARRYLQAQHGIGDGRGPAHARLWGSRRTAALEAAALFNGIAGHVLDYDDVTAPMRGHPSIALWPALLALADARDLPGRRLASAYTLGFEVIGKLSRTMAAAHYARGWHSTSSIGTLAAAAACAHLLALDEDQTVHALGLAVAMCGGTRQNFGTDAKSFQAGQCNAAALRAALLAEQGFTAAEDAIDGDLGFLSLYGRNEDLGPALDTLGRPPLELLRSGIEVKQYPMCYAAHRSIDGVLALRHAHGLNLAHVRAVDIEASRDGLLPLIHHRPTTGLEAKFSIEYAVAAALADGSVRLASFDDAAVQRPEIAAFMPRVQAREARDGGLLPRYADIALKLHNGTVLRHHVDVQHGAAEDPLSDAELVAKGADCLAYAGRALDAGGLFQAALALPEQPARAWLDALASGSER